ncbi:hypothetical protein B566_EDAN008473 [Ephemera danica]|nr:hypothetical protein B566_EDAN008473 [Ephemera danica]
MRSMPQQSSLTGTILEPISYFPSGPSQPPRPPSSNSLLFTSQSSSGLGAFYAPATLHPPSKPPPTPQHHHSGGNFTLDSIKLPPGITITKVETPQHQHGNMVQNKEPQHPPEMRQYMPPAATMPPGVTMSNPRMGQGMHGMPGGMGMGGGMGMVNPNVIVVDTGKLMEDSKNSNHQAKSGELNGMGPNQRAQNGGQQVPSGNYVTLKRIVHDDHGSSVSIIPSSCEMNANGDQNSSSKKKKNKKKNKGKKVDEWNLVESVFAPKDIDLDAVDDDERELEAFKRFCFNSVPPERKEKVHLNLKDLVIKKKP